MGIHLLPPLYKVVMGKVETTVFYPSLDGNAGVITVGTWAEVQGGVGNNHQDTETAMKAELRTSSQTDKFYDFHRMLLLLDLSILGLIEVRKALVSLYGILKANDLGAAPTLNIFESNPAAITALEDADYSCLGTTPLANSISYVDFSITGYNDFTLNAAGRALIQAASKGDGIVKLGAREASYDAPNNNPGWHDLTNPISGFRAWTVEKGTIYRPKLTLEYVKY